MKAFWGVMVTRESASIVARFDDVIAWVLLSEEPPVDRILTCQEIVYWICRTLFALLRRYLIDVVGGGTR